MVDLVSESWPSAVFISLLRFRFAVELGLLARLAAGIKLRNLSPPSRNFLGGVIHGSFIKSALKDSDFVDATAALLLILGQVLEILGLSVGLLLLG